MLRPRITEGERERKKCERIRESVRGRKQRNIDEKKGSKEEI